MIFKVLVYGIPSHWQPFHWGKHYINTSKKSSYVKEPEGKGIVLFIVNTVCHEWKYIGMLRRPSGRLNQHESTWKIAGKTESSVQIVLCIFRTKINRSFINQFVTGLTTVTWGEHVYKTQIPSTIDVVPHDRSSLGTWRRDLRELHVSCSLRVWDLCEQPLDFTVTDGLEQVASSEVLSSPLPCFEQEWSRYHALVSFSLPASSATKGTAAKGKIASHN